MNGDRIAALIGLLGALVLAGSGLVRRRPDTRRLLILAGMWVGIVAVAWLVASVAFTVRRS